MRVSEDGPDVGFWELAACAGQARGSGTQRPATTGLENLRLLPEPLSISVCSTLHFSGGTFGDVRLPPVAGHRAEFGQDSGFVHSLSCLTEPGR